MGVPPASECAAIDRSDDDRNSVRNDIGVDGEWKHQRLREGQSQYRPVGFGGHFIEYITMPAQSSLNIGQLI